MSEALPIGTITLLLADVDGSTGLWEAEPDAMAAALARLDLLVEETVSGHGGVRPVEQGEGDSFVVAFTRPSSAVACALDLQRAPLAPMRLRIGLHFGEAKLSGENNYVGPAVNRAVRLRDLAHGGQTVMSGTTHDLVADNLPADAWLVDLGSHRLRDLARPERVSQLCHPDLAVEFPPLRSLDAVAHNLPVQLTNFVGRHAELAEVRRLLVDNRLVTLTGTGGAGKTRLALQVAAEVLADFPDGLWLADLAPTADPAAVPLAVARALGLPDEAHRSTKETLVGFFAGGQMLVVLDNCEHLLDACAALIEDLLRACPALTILATSREPIGVAGEVMWRVPSLSLASDAVELFVERAGRAHPGFVAADHTEEVAEICRRLDGIPLAIELAAARLRALSPAEIVTGLHDRFRLLTGGARTALPRQQTLRASVDWSHALLTEPERTLFRRTATFPGAFDLEAARSVCSGDGLERHQVLDQLALLVDKSLIGTEDSQLASRYRLLETVRQYGLERLAESGEADAVRTRHRDHYAHMAARLDTLVGGENRDHIKCLGADIDNLRAAFQWSREIEDVEAALRLASSLQPLWLGQGRTLEGLTWFDAAFADAGLQGVAAGVRVRARADAVVLDAWRANLSRLDQAQEAVTLARTLNDPPLLGRVLAAAGCAAGYLVDLGRPYFAEAIGLARQADDSWTVAQILGWQTFAAVISGDPPWGIPIAEEGQELAELTGNQHVSRQCRTWLGALMNMQGDLSAARDLLRDVVAEAEAEHAPIWKMWGLAGVGHTLALLGQADEARAAGQASIAIAADLGVAAYAGFGYLCLSQAAMIAGDAAALRQSSRAGWEHMRFRSEFGVVHRVDMAEADLAAGDLVRARQSADEALATATALSMKQPLARALLTSAHVTGAVGDADRAREYAREALVVGHGIGAKPQIVDALESLASLGHDSNDLRERIRLLGAADAIRGQVGVVRPLLYQPAYDMHVTDLRTSVGDVEFEQSWAEGAALTVDEAVAYALRGRGERKHRPTAGWESLTPTEREVVRLVGEGLANKDVATRLFVSPRTVQSHLTHIYTKTGINSRVQLAQEALRRT
jgi:predicted ATPase/class 3 adenylate cyclase/DNA-binding CsgD family transcriptional regulator